MKARDVFTPGRFPTVTYIDDHLKDKERQLLDTIDAGAMLVSISGPSKSGKTVFVEQCLGRENLVQVTGAGVNSPTELWMRVFDLIGTPVSVVSTREESSGGSVSGTGSVEGNIIVAKGKVDATVSRDRSSQTSESATKSIDPLQLLIKELGGTNFAVFIDDFHYIPKPVQVELARQIKEAIRNDVRLITASVPYHSDDVLRSNPDLRGRVTLLDFDYWQSDVLTKIATKGFQALNINASPAVLEKLTAEAAGSPQLMQYLCLNSCFELDARGRSETAVEFEDDRTVFENICRRTAMSADYVSIVEKMKEGPKTRGSDRNIYITTFGWQGDVYRLLAKALSLDPPQLTLRYQALIDRINSICVSSSPSGSSVTNSCYHTAAIVNEATPNAVIEWDSENDVLDIRDPYLLFYLRWADAVDG